MVQTVAVLLGVLAVIYFFTKDSTPEVSEQSETVSLMETSEETQVMSENQGQMSESDAEEMGEEMVSEEMGQEMGEEMVSEESEMKPQPKKYNVTGYGGSDFSSF